MLGILNRALDFAGTEAARANVQASRGAVHDRANSLQVRGPSAFCTDMRVTYLHADLYPFTANGAFTCHNSTSSRVTEITHVF